MNNKYPFTIVDSKVIFEIFSWNRRNLSLNKYEMFSKSIETKSLK